MTRARGRCPQADTPVRPNEHAPCLGHGTVTWQPRAPVGSRRLSSMHGKDSLTVKLRLPAVAAAVLIAAAVLVPSAQAASTTVVIAQLQVHGPSGGNDEFIQLKNISGTAQDI